MSDLAYYQSLRDYESLKPFLDIDPAGYEIPLDLPTFEPDFSTLIIIDNIPTVIPEKIEKLKDVLLKIYRPICDKIQEDDIFMPLDSNTGQTYGFCFIKFKSKAEADMAVQNTNDLTLGRSKFIVNYYADLDKYNAITEEYVPPEPTPFHPRPDRTSWLSDTQCRDMFVIRHGLDTEICWGSATIGEDPSLVYGGEREKQNGRTWCESYVNWSPQGTYLATFHTPGIRIWGGESFEAQPVRFLHSGVEEMSFSPCENYLITSRLFDQDPKHAQSSKPIIVWDVRSGEVLRTFDLKSPLDAKFHVEAMIMPKDDDMKGKGGAKRIERAVRGRIGDYNPENRTYKVIEGTLEHVVHEDKIRPLQDPNKLKWSHCGKYVARIGCDIITVYELPSMQILESKSILAKDVLDFSWSPGSSMISYWCPASGNYPALVNIIQLPERTEVCSRKLFDVQDGRMIWQNDGDYLCVHMTKTQGKKRSFVLMFFRVRDLGVPVDQLELSEPVSHVSWEPSGDRFVIIHGEPRNCTVSFYSMAAVASTAATEKSKNSYAAKIAMGTTPKKEITNLFNLTGRQCSEVLWSPAGSVAALYYFAADSCVFELYDVENNLQLASKRHDRCNRLLWDPSGRILVTCTLSNLRQSSVRAVNDDGYNFYTFQGHNVATIRKDKLYQFSWRPRPKDLLSTEEKKKVIKNLKKYEKEFDKADKARKQELDTAVMAERRALAVDFLTLMSRRRSQVRALRDTKIALQDGYDSEDDGNFQIGVKFEETILSTKEQILH